MIAPFFTEKEKKMKIQHNVNTDAINLQWIISLCPTLYVSSAILSKWVDWYWYRAHVVTIFLLHPCHLYTFNSTKNVTIKFIRGFYGSIGYKSRRKIDF